MKGFKLVLTWALALLGFCGRSAYAADPQGSVKSRSDRCPQLASGSTTKGYHVSIYVPLPNAGSKKASPYWLMALYLASKLGENADVTLEHANGSFDALLKLEPEPGKVEDPLHGKLALAQADVVYHYRFGNHPQFPNAKDTSAVRLLTPLFTEKLFICGSSVQPADSDAAIINAPWVLGGESGSGTRVTAINLGRTLGAAWQSHVADGEPPSLVPALEVRASSTCTTQQWFLSQASVSIMHNAYPAVYDLIDTGDRRPGLGILGIRAQLVANKGLTDEIIEALQSGVCFSQVRFPVLDRDSRASHSDDASDKCFSADTVAARLQSTWDERFSGCAMEQECNENPISCGRELARDIGDPDEHPSTYEPLIARHLRLSINGPVETWLRGLSSDLNAFLGRKPRGDAPGAFWIVLFTWFFVLGLGLMSLVGRSVRLGRSWRQRLERQDTDTAVKRGIRWLTLLLPLLISWAVSALIHMEQSTRQRETLWSQLAPSLCVIAGGLGFVLLMQTFAGAVPTSLWACPPWYALLRIRYSAFTQRVLWAPFTFILLWMFGGGALIWTIEFFANTLKPETDLVTGGVFKASIRVLAIMFGNPAPELRSEWSDVVLAMFRYTSVVVVAIISFYLTRVVVRDLNRSARVVTISRGAATNAFFNQVIERPWAIGSYEALDHPGVEHKQEPPHQCGTLRQGLFQFDFLNARLIAIDDTLDAKSLEQVRRTLATASNPPARLRRAARGVLSMLHLSALAARWIQEHAQSPNIYVASAALSGNTGHTCALCCDGDSQHYDCGRLTIVTASDSDHVVQDATARESARYLLRIQALMIYVLVVAFQICIGVFLLGPHA